MSKATVVELSWNKDAEDELIDVAMEMLWHVGQETLRIAQNNIPLETGTLRRSGTVTIGYLPDAEDVFLNAFGMPKDNVAGKWQQNAFKDKKLGDATSVYVSYSAPYALRLHEDMKWNPRDWKYSYHKRKSIAQGYTRKSNRFGFEGMYFKRVPKPAVGGPKWLSNALPLAWAKRFQFLEYVKRKRGIS